MNQPKKPIIWSISGSDCSGGAGIAADIKTGHALGVEVCHLITANTVQNSKQLVSVNPIACDILQQQVEALITDKPPSIIKVGIVATLAQVNWLTDTLATLRRQFPTLKTVYDPVGSASVSGTFIDYPLTALSSLLKEIDVITPNLGEAQQLSQLAKVDSAQANGSDISPAEIMAAGILSLGVKSVIIKGGHVAPNSEHQASNKADNNKVTDYCLNRLDTDLASAIKTPEMAATAVSYQLSSERIDSRYSHGGGCSFASAIASYLAHGYLLRDAFTLAKAFMQKGFIANFGRNDSYGAFEQVSHAKETSGPRTESQCTEKQSIENQQKTVIGHHFPQVEDKVNQSYQALGGFKTLGLPDKTNSEIKRDGSQSLGIYPVVDSLEWLERLLPLELNIIQLRIKDISDFKALDGIIAKAVALYKNSATRLFINDYWQLAIKHGAYGVHIGQEDLQDADLSAIQQAGLRLGVSTHGCYEFLLAQQLKPSYLAIGAIFPTNTKDMTGQIQGLDNLQSILSLSTDIPIVAIGGINHERAARVWQTGVDSLAVVTAITEAENPEQATKALQSLCRESILI